MIKRLSALVLALSLLPSLAAAQTVRADRFTLNAGPCTMRSGVGPPSPTLGVLCDTYMNTTTGDLWVRQPSAWTIAFVAGTGSIGKLTKWLTSHSITDSSVDEYSTPVILRLSPAGDIEVNPGGKDILPTLGYDTNLGMLTKKFLSLHAAELWVETLVAQSTMATIGGRILVAPTTLLTGDLAAAATSMTVKQNNLASGDIVYMEANGQVEFMAVTSGAGGSAGAYTYSITRNLDGTGANNWTAGDAILNTGTTGNGFLDIYSVRGVRAGTEIGPTVVANRRNSSTYNDWSPRAAFGNLNGLYGYSSSVYGSAFGTPGGARVLIDETNGIRIFGGDNDEKFTVDLSGNATFDGNITVGTGKNMIRNSDCKVSTEGWFLFSNTGAATLGGPWPTSASWGLGGLENDCYISVAGTPTAGTVSSIYGGGTDDQSGFPAQAGLRYEASAYVGVHRSGTTQAILQFIDATPAVIANFGGNACNAFTGTGGTALSGYCRTGIIATAPAGTVSVRFVLQTIHTAEAAPFIFMVHSFLGEAKTQQEDLSEWGPAGVTSINGGIIETEAITTRTLAADSITSAKIAAGTIVASDIASGTITSGQIAAGTITASNIAAGTITGDMINGGTITGVTVRAGSSNEVLLNSSGITISGGTATQNNIKWTDGTIIRSNGSGYLDAYANADITLWANVDGGGNILFWTGSELRAGGSSLGTNSARWGTLYADYARFTTLAGAGSNRFVCNDINGDIYTSAGTCDGSAPAPTALAEQVSALQAEVAELKAAMAQLLAAQKQ